MKNEGLAFFFDVDGFDGNPSAHANGVSADASTDVSDADDKGDRVGTDRLFAGGGDGEIILAAGEIIFVMCQLWRKLESSSSSSSSYLAPRRSLSFIILSTADYCRERAILFTICLWTFAPMNRQLYSVGHINGCTHSIYCVVVAPDHMHLQDMRVLR